MNVLNSGRSHEQLTGGTRSTRAESMIAETAGENVNNAQTEAQKIKERTMEFNKLSKITIRSSNMAGMIGCESSIGPMRVLEER